MVAYAPSRDIIDHYLQQWRAVRPDVDTTAMFISGRAARVALGFQRVIEPVLGRHSLQRWEYDVLATLRRTNSTAGLSMSELTRQLLLAAGSTTHRIDLLVRRKLVTRHADPESRRRVLVALTPKGRQRIDDVLPELADEITATLSAIKPTDRKAINSALRVLMRVLDDRFAQRQHASRPRVEGRRVARKAKSLKRSSFNQYERSR